MLQLLFVLSMVIVFSACSKKSEGTSSPHGEPDLLSDYRGNNKEVWNRNRIIVERAAQAMEEGKTYIVTGSAPSQCTSTSFNYELRKSGSRIVLNQRIRFELNEELSESRETEIFYTINRCASFIKDLWLPYGIDWVLETDSNLRATFKDPHYRPKLIDDFGRSSTAEFYYKGQAEVPNFEDQKMLQDNFCTMMAHEFGHYLGLPDEYSEEGTCRTKEFESIDEAPWSIMETTNYGWGTFEYLPRHIEQVLEQALPMKMKLRLLQEPDWETMSPNLLFAGFELGRPVSEEMKSGESPNCKLFVTRNKPQFDKDYELIRSGNRYNYYSSQGLTYFETFESSSPYFTVLCESKRPIHPSDLQEIIGQENAEIELLEQF